jgi:hypothetical protein
VKSALGQAAVNIAAHAGAHVIATMRNASRPSILAYRCADVDGHQLFYCEAAKQNSPALVPTALAQRVAVGTRITPRPRHRSRRALLTHRAPPSGRTSAAHGLKPHTFRRTAANRIDVASRLSVRTTAACRLFPSGEALPSETSAGSCLPLFGRFLGTTTSSDFSAAYMATSK